MVNRQIQRLKASKRLLVLWIMLSVFLIGFILHITLKNEYLKQQLLLNQASEEMNDKLDKFFDKLQTTLYALPLSTTLSNNCPPNIKSAFNSILFNNPQLSGIEIRNQENKVLCSSREEISIPEIKMIQSVDLYGPFQPKPSDKPVLLMLQRINQYYVGLYILTDVIASQLKTDTKNINSITLYDDLRQTVLISMNHKSDSLPWQMNHKPLPKLNNHKSEYNFIKNKMGMMPNISLLVTMHKKPLQSQLLHHELTSGLSLLFLLIFIYLGLNRVLQHHFSLQRAIKNGIKDNQFFPVYQPIYNSKNKAFCGAEALMRWQADTNEIIYPDVFIEEAETSGLIVEMTLQMVEKTFKELKTFLNKNPEFHIAFNLSSQHFSEVIFFEAFQELCAQYGIPNQQIVLELTERSLYSQHDSTLINILHQLRRAGFSLAIDDFGTGHASISYLQHFPFNYLKVDRIFVQSIGTGAITETLSASIIHMAHALNMEIIAEGVETPEQQSFLESQGVYLLQGWLFAKAQPYEHFIKIINGASL